MKLFCLVDTATNLPLRLTVDSVAVGGSTYDSYDVPEFNLELTNDYSKENPVWTTDDESLAMKLAANAKKDVRPQSQNLSEPNCRVWTEGEIVVRPLLVA